MPNAFAISLALITAALVGGVYIGGTMLAPLQTVAYFGALVLGVALVLRFFEWAAAGGRAPPMINITPVPAGPGVPQIQPPLPTALPPPAPPPPPPPSDFERCLAVTLKNEGGNDDDPNDPGGRTSRGITAGDWAAWRQTHPGLPSDVWQAPQDQIEAIYKERYWDVVQGDQLPAGVDMMVFDIGVLTGVGEAAMLLEGIVGTDVDGEIGPLTIAAAKIANATDVVNKLSANWLRYLQTRGNAATYIRGWTSRVNYTTQQALAMVGTAPTTATAPTSPTGAPWVTLGRTYVDNVVWADGPMPSQIVAWLDAVVAKFPEEAAYVQTLKNLGAKGWWAWCGAYVRCMLAPFGIKGPISAAGLSGQTTEDDWAYVSKHAPNPSSWRTWGTKIWDAMDGIPISQAQPQIGDVLIWDASGIHHVSFYGKPLPDTNTFDSLGGDQGKPLRVCEEELPMSWCVAIRRPPAPG